MLTGSERHPETGEAHLRPFASSFISAPPVITITQHLEHSTHGTHTEPSRGPMRPPKRIYTAATSETVRLDNPPISAPSTPTTSSDLPAERCEQ